tara:strand:+ start:168 stop:764 length:597 start_codon:yes stop_codon:yes gene_type:complete
MIELIDINNAEPYKKFLKYYSAALKANQHLVEAISISSFSKLNNEVNSRYVNLKYIHDESWIFFSNYNSPKAIEFQDHNQVSALFYWNSINVQIRVKAFIEKTPKQFSDNHFKSRDHKKNAIAISSDQSKIINSHKDVEKNYSNALLLNNINERPNYWGGFSFKPYYFEFWEGQEYRLNIRNAYEMKDSKWMHCILQP